MEGFIRNLLITSGGLASTEKCKRSIWHAMFHQFGDLQIAIAETKSAFDRFDQILQSMTCKVRQRSTRQVKKHVRYRRGHLFCPKLDQALLLHMLFNPLELLTSIRKSGSTLNLRLNNGEHFELGDCRR